MKTGDKKPFMDNPVLLQEMLYLRQVKKMSYPKLAKKFGVDHSSIIYQCQKNGISKDSTGYFLNKNIKRIQPVYTGVSYKKIYKSELELTPTITERINAGHSYAWYVKREEQKTKSKARILIESLRGPIFQK